jgi:hypothetical protein
VDVLSGPVVLVLGQDEATALGRQLAETLRLAYRSRGQMPPSLLTAFADRLSTAARAARGQVPAQVTAGGGPGKGRSGPPLPVSEQPATLTVDQAAVLAEVDPRTVRKWIARREVEAARGPRGAYRVDIASLGLWISEHRKGDCYPKAACCRLTTTTRNCGSRWSPMKSGNPSLRPS